MRGEQQKRRERVDVEVKPQEANNSPIEIQPLGRAAMMSLSSLLLFSLVSLLLRLSSPLSKLPSLAQRTLPGSSQSLASDPPKGRVKQGGRVKQKREGDVAREAVRYSAEGDVRRINGGRPLEPIHGQPFGLAHPFTPTSPPKAVRKPLRLTICGRILSLG